MSRLLKANVRSHKRSGKNGRIAFVHSYARNNHPQFEEFVRKSLENAQYQGRIRLDVSDDQKHKIEELLGYPVISHEILSDDIRHLYNSHGNQKLEESRNQLPITVEDVLRIPMILEDFDSVAFGSKTKQGKNSLVYKKRVNGHIFYVEVEASKRGILLGKTMWKKPSGRIDAVGPNHTSLTAPSPSFKKSIPFIFKIIKPKKFNHFKLKGEVT